MKLADVEISRVGEKKKNDGTDRPDLSGGRAPQRCGEGPLPGEGVGQAKVSKYLAESSFSMHLSVVFCKRVTSGSLVGWMAD